MGPAKIIEQSCLSPAFIFCRLLRHKFDNTPKNEKRIIKCVNKDESVRNHIQRPVCLFILIL
jgi:hypothetical protein